MKFPHKDSGRDLAYGTTAGTEVPIFAITHLYYNYFVKSCQFIYN
jgi:hypothetical protein